MTERSTRGVGNVLATLLVMAVVVAGVVPALHDHTTSRDGSRDQCAVCRVAHEFHSLPTTGTTTAMVALPLTTRISEARSSRPGFERPTEPAVRGPPLSI
jgi:hypothetical protein